MSEGPARLGCGHEEIHRNRILPVPATPCGDPCVQNEELWLPKTGNIADLRTQFIGEEDGG